VAVWPVAENEVPVSFPLVREGERGRRVGNGDVRDIKVKTDGGLEA
jgi:hypothetical protein